jgi:hypothetical protein
VPQRWLYGAHVQVVKAVCMSVCACGVCSYISWASNTKSSEAVKNVCSKEAPHNVSRRQVKCKP